MDSIERVLVALPKVHGARPERIGRPTRDAEATLQLAKLRANVRPALDHLLGRIPIRPFLFALYAVAGCGRGSWSGPALASTALPFSIYSAYAAGMGPGGSTTAFIRM